MIDALDQAIAAPSPDLTQNPFSVGAQPNPYGQPNPYLPQNPYPQAPPPYNPYGGPPPPVQAPVQYPYNPYQNPLGGAAPPHTTGVQPPGMQVPIYYPPPPRPPLLKPEHRMVLGKIGVTALVLGTLFFLLWVGIQAVADAYQRQNAAARDSRVPKPSASGSVQDRLTKEAQYREQVSSPSAKTEADARRATLLIAQARMIFDSSAPDAEQQLRDAIALDPGNPDAPASLGELYVRNAERSEDQRSRAELWHEAGRAYTAASRLYSSAGQRQQAQSLGAQALFRAAQEAQQLGESRSARTMLYEARDIAPAGSEIANSIQGLLADLTNG
jgi:serine/threonine-protein kinase